MYVILTVDFQSLLKMYRVINNAIMKLLYVFFGIHLYAFLLSMYLGVELLDHRVLVNNVK